MSSTVLAVAALAASLLLFFQTKVRVPAIVAIIVSGLEVLLAFGVLSLSLRGMPLELILGAILGIAGALLYTKVGAKMAVSAATVIVLVAVLQVLGALGVL